MAIFAGGWLFTLVSAASTPGTPSSLTWVTNPWQGLKPATCMPDHCFCEADRGGWVRQPANTLSSLGFLIAAAAVLALARRERKLDFGSSGTASLMRRSAVLPALYSASLVLIGIGTGFYHASLSFVGQTFDVLGMYLLATLFLLYGAMRLIALRERDVFFAYILANVILLWGLILAPGLRRYVFALLILAVIVMEVLIRRRLDVAARGVYFFAAIGILAIGFAIWIADITGTVCSPQSLIQGHAIWHVCGAVSSYLLFLYYRSEQYGAPLRTRGH